jgi:hypothetical protein
MAREVKRFELRTIDDELEKVPSVVRLENELTQRKEAPVRLPVDATDTEVSQRLDLLELDIAELRTHQPKIEALIEPDQENHTNTEETWGADGEANKSLPWGWFVLIASILAASVIWSLSRVNEADITADEIKLSTASAIVDDEKEKREASELIDKIENTIHEFYRLPTVEDRALLIRHPDRVRPLMAAHYAEKSIPTSQQVTIQILQPVTLEDRANFWMASLALPNGEKPNMLIEVLKSGEVQIDWETLVCHQPIPWETFVQNRPSGISLDFRVSVEADTFFSHEFINSNQWTCFRLTALGSDSPLFGYARANSEIATTIEKILQRNTSGKGSMILRLSIPEGLNSRSGVVIEKVLSPRWIYVDPPNAEL